MSIEDVMPLPMFGKEAEEPISKIKNVIAIAAGKGGVGKSTVTVNLALTLKQKGFMVGILDTDIYGPSIRMMLPEEKLPARKGDFLIPAQAQGISLISMAFFRRENEASAVRAPIANRIINQFLDQVVWGGLDFLLIDFPPGTGDIQLTLAQNARIDAAIMVTTPQEVAMLDVRKAMDLFQQVKIPIVGIIENMSYYENMETKERLFLMGEGGGQRLAQETGVPFLGSIPINPKISECCDRGVSIFKQQDSASEQAKRAFFAIADGLSQYMERLNSSSEGCLDNFTLEWKDLS